MWVVRQDEVLLPSGEHTTVFFVEHNGRGAVFVQPPVLNRGDNEWLATYVRGALAKSGSTDIRRPIGPIEDRGRIGMAHLTGSDKN
jgi:hypothetical protein